MSGFGDVFNTVAQAKGLPLEKLSIIIAEKLIILLITKEIFDEEVVSNASGFTSEYLRVGSRAHVLESGQERIILKTRSKETSLPAGAATSGEFMDPLSAFDDPEENDDEEEATQNRGGVTIHSSAAKGSRSKSIFGKYFVEFAKSGRAECVKCSETIDNKTLRIGTNVPVKRKKVKSVVFTHLECFRLSRDTSGEEFLENLTGFNELPAREQLLVRNTVATKGKGKADNKTSQQSTASSTPVQRQGNISAIIPGTGTGTGNGKSKAPLRQQQVVAIDDDDIFGDDDEPDRNDPIVDNTQSIFVSTAKPKTKHTEEITKKAASNATSAQIVSSTKKRPFLPPYKSVTSLIDGDDIYCDDDEEEFLNPPSRKGVRGKFIEVLDTPSPHPLKEVDKRKSNVPLSSNRTDTKKRASSGGLTNSTQSVSKRSRVPANTDEALFSDEEEEEDDDDDEEIFSVEADEDVEEVEVNENVEPVPDQVVSSTQSDAPSSAPERYVLTKRQQRALNEWLEAFRKRWNK